MNGTMSTDKFAGVCVKSPAAGRSTGRIGSKYLDHALIATYLSSSAIRLEVSQRLPPIFWTCE